MHNTHSTEIFFTATAMQNCHGRTVLDFLMDYWTISQSMHKLGPTGKRQMFYLVLNSMGEYIKLLRIECLASNIYILHTSVSKSLSINCATQEFLNIKRKPCAIYSGVDTKILPNL